MAKFTQTLMPSTRMAIQAALAVTIAILLGHWLQFERAYWAILTAMVLISQTWGESIRKSITRICMTIIGGITGTLIYFCIKDSDYLLFTCLLSCIFFIVFFLEISYLWVVFFLTNMVVFMFALLQGWNTHLLIARIEETFIGAIITIVTSAFILPSHAKTQLDKDLPQLLRLAAELTDDCINQLLHQQKTTVLVNKKRLRLLKAFALLENHAKTMNYEVFFSSYSQKQLKTMLPTLNVLIHYVISLVETLPFIQYTESQALIKQELIKVKHIVKLNFSSVIEYLHDFPAHLKLNDLEESKAAIFTKINATIQQDITTKSSWFEFYSFFYFVRRINEVLLEL